MVGYPVYTATVCSSIAVHLESIRYKKLEKWILMYYIIMPGTSFKFFEWYARQANIIYYTIEL